MSHHNQSSLSDSSGGRGYGHGGGPVPFVPTIRPSIPSASPIVRTPAIGSSTTVPTLAAVVSASSSSSTALEAVTSGSEKLALQPVVPSSSKVLRSPTRLGFGKVRAKVQVSANHFLVEVCDRDLTSTSIIWVAITPEEHSLDDNSFFGHLPITSGNLSSLTTLVLCMKEKSKIGIRVGMCPPPNMVYPLGLTASYG
ncbi:hypothetical protein PIB30_086666 [Stylosanthes scabra]|uniref:Uncharacterized protein n=1 Tax=Stylosanthes scabra TaxID=79078 RepID=A0ABU6SUQ6_9FABA|nr:hypothetical protein [Stylosanthes scabra]